MIKCYHRGTRDNGKRCQAQALSGSDFCRDHIGQAVYCIVRYCPGSAVYANHICTPHFAEWVAARDHTICLWLTARFNEGDRRLAGLREAIYEAPQRRPTKGLLTTPLTDPFLPPL